MISARDNTAALIEKIEEDKEWVKVGDKDSDETRAMSKVSSNDRMMGPFDTKS